MRLSARKGGGIVKHINTDGILTVPHIVRGKPMKPVNPWDAAKQREVIRSSPPYCGMILYPPADLEPGVKYFVLMLEQLGAVTTYSCEGHPNGFYISFIASHKLARRIAKAGFFTVEIDKGNHNGWDLRLRKMSSERKKHQCLRWAAAAWDNHLGPLK
jgi:hypothetical protein